MFGHLIRHRNWTLGAILALVVVGLVFVFTAGGSSPDFRASSSHSSTPSAAVTIQDQLHRQGYARTGTMQTDSSDAHRTIKGEIWMVANDHTRPVVFLTDAYPGYPGTFVIDSVSYGPTDGFGQFWCVPPRLTDATNVAVTLSAAYQTRQAILKGESAPVSSDVPGTDKVLAATICYMK